MEPGAGKQSFKGLPAVTKNGPFALTNLPDLDHFTAFFEIFSIQLTKIIWFGVSWERTMIKSQYSCRALKSRKNGSNILGYRIQNNICGQVPTKILSRIERAGS